MNPLSFNQPTKTDSLSGTRRERILVVDDSPDNLFLVQTILEEEGYEILLAEDGPSALDEIETQPPELVLLDVMMPGMDGFQVTKRIRSNTKLPFIPILLITAYDQPSVVQGLDTGADDFIRKPVEVDELLARVRSLLRLKHSVDERDQIARQREDFVSWMTHDLRTPIVAADRMLTLFNQGALGELPAQMQEAITTMARSNRNLLAMVNTLLEVYRYEAGRKILSFTTLDVGQLLKEVVEELAPLAEEKNLFLKLHLPQKIEAQKLIGAASVEVQDQEEIAQNAPVSESYKVVGDRMELHRVFTNLVGNGIKFTDNGGVDVSLNVNNDQLAIAIADTGSGISPEEQKIVFDRFRQGNHKRSGSGLGLHLSRRIILAHQGTIELSSEVGKGSIFTVCLPKQ